MTWTSPKRFGNSSGPTAPLPGCEFLWSVSPPSCKKKKNPTLQRACYDSVRLIAFPAGSRRTRSGSASSKKRQSVFWFFFKLPPGGGCSGCDLLVTCIRCSRGRCFRLFVTFRCDDDSSDVKWTTVQVRTCNFSWCDGSLFLLRLMLEMHLRLVYCAFWSVLSTFYIIELSDSAFRRFFPWYTHVTQFKKVFLLLKESIYSRLE